MSQEFVKLAITSSISDYVVNRTFNRSLTIPEFKKRLVLITGSEIANMSLSLFDENNNHISDFTDDTTLSSYPIKDGMRIHVTDSATRKGEFDDVSNVEKMTISKERYEEISDFDKYAREHGIGKYSSENKGKVHDLKLGDRCRVKLKNQPVRIGTVMFTGTTHLNDKKLLGIRYDEPLGKNDGTLDNIRYFTCEPNHGVFVHPMFVSRLSDDEPSSNEYEIDEI